MNTNSEYNASRAYGYLNGILYDLKNGRITQSRAKKEICRLFVPKECVE